MESRRPLYVYLATNRKVDDKHITTKIGCASDVDERLALLNAPSPAPGSERRTRHAPGHWRMLLVVVVPPSLSARAIADQWARDARKLHCRFQYGIESIAWHYGLPYLVDFEEMRADAALASAIPAFVRTIEARACPDTATVSRLARALTSSSFCVSTTRFKNMSFAAADRPRDRYRKRRATATATTTTEASSSPSKAARTVTVRSLDALLYESLQ